MSSSEFLPESTHFCLCHQVWPESVLAPTLPKLLTGNGRWFCICPCCNFYVGGYTGFENRHAAVAMWQTCCKPGDQHIKDLWVQSYSTLNAKSATGTES